MLRTRRGVAAGGIVLVAVLLAAVVVVVQPWSSEGESSAPDFGSGELMIQDSDNNREVVSPEQLIEAFPLPIKLPEYIPAGYELANVTFHQPPPGLDPLTFGNSLVARYQNPTEPGGLMFTQRPGSGLGTTDVPTEAVSVLGTEGQYIELDRAEGIQTLIWSRCARVFMLDSSPLGALSRENLVRVAESVGPEGCPPEPTREPEPTVDNGRFGSARLDIEGVDGARRPVGAEEFEAAYPGEILLPAYLPDGATFGSATVRARADLAATSVVTRYGGVNGGFNMVQRGESFLTEERLSNARHQVHGSPAYLQSESGTQILFWSRCEQSFMITAPPRTASETDLLRLAESVGPEECP